MKTNSDVTDALRRTVSLMQAELERSVLTTQMLDSSTATLRSTSLQHDTLNTVMSTSKQLITALEKSDWLDRILIISGFVFFLLVVLFILKQRIIDRGLKVAFWWTRFLPDFSSTPISNIPDPSPILAITKDSFIIVDTQTSFLPTDSPEAVSETTYQTEQIPTTSLPGHIEL